MENAGIEAFVKYNYFHKEQKRAWKKDAFAIQNLYYNRERDYYVCPMGQHMEYTGQRKSKSDMGYVSVLKRYQAQNCEGCPLKSQCHKSKTNRIIEVNYNLNRYKQEAREKLMSEEGIYHRGRRCIEPEAVFAQIKHNSAWNRFRLRGLEKVKTEFTLVAIAHNLRKLAKKVSSLLFFTYFCRITSRRETIEKTKDVLKAGTYYFPRIEEGKTFSFEVVSAFSGYAPSKFNGFLISSEVLQRTLQQELEEQKETDKDTPERRFGMPTTPKEDRREPAQSKVSPNKVYKGSEVDKEPEYPGGNQALLADIARSIRYPMICKQQKIQGDVLVSFIVEKDGSVSDVTAVKKVHANLNTEAVRVVKSLKEWTPGIKDGQPVRVQSAVYVTFSL